MTLVLSPCGGFGNRIRSLCGGVILAKELGLTIEHLWDGGDYKTAAHHSSDFQHIQETHDLGFEYFFEPKLSRYTDKSISTYYNQWNNSIGWFQYQNYAYKKLKFTDINLLSADTIIKGNSICIETTQIPFPISNQQYTETYKKFFIPRESFVKQLPSLTKNTIGISIRNGNDFRAYFPDCIVEEKDLILFLQKFEEPVVLFSDEKDYAKRLKKFLKNPVEIPFENNSVKDNNFLEFLTLANCSHIYGTNKSSFAEEAALFRGASYTPIVPPKN
jgi:hypothetical protein